MRCEFCDASIERGRFCNRTCSNRAKTSGGLVRGKDGRCRVRLRNGNKQLYSRAVMEGHLRRHLTYDEVVHHKNGDPTDDRIENLEVMSRAEHVQMHVADMTAGTRAKRAKLSQAQAAEIRNSTERTSVLARRYGVTEGAIVYHRGSLKAHGRIG